MAEYLQAAAPVSDNEAAMGATQPMTDLVGGMVLRMFTWLQVFSAWTRGAKSG